jgi:putative membrane protein
MKHPLVNLLVRWSVLALGVALAAAIVPGIDYHHDAWTLLAVVALLSLFNAILRPVLLLFTLPFILLTMGLGVVFINALLFLWVGRLVDGFEVKSFGSALLGSLIVSVTNIVMSRFLRNSSGRPPPAAGRPPAKRDDVIDI